MSPDVITEAASFLAARGISRMEMSPRDFAQAAKDLGKSFDELLNLLGRMMQGGQGLGPAPYSEAVARKQPVAP